MSEIETLSAPEQERTRYRCQYSIRSMLSVALAFSLALSWFSWRASIDRREQEAIRVLRTLGASVEQQEPRFQLLGVPLTDRETMIQVSESRLNSSRLEDIRALVELTIADVPVCPEMGIALGSASKLKSLTLTNTKCPRDIWRQIGATSSLRQLSLIDVPLSDSGSRAISSLSGLESLTLIRTGPLSKILPHLEHSTNLLELTIVGSHIEGTELSLLESHRKLEILNLRNNQLSADDLQYLPPLLTLTHLGLADNRISGGLRPLRRLQTLVSLDVEGNTLEAEDLSDIASLPCLVCVTITANLTNQLALDRLGMQNPQLRITLH